MQINEFKEKKMKKNVSKLHKNPIRMKHIIITTENVQKAQSWNNFLKINENKKNRIKQFAKCRKTTFNRVMSFRLKP